MSSSPADNWTVDELGRDFETRKVLSADGVQPLGGSLLPSRYARGQQDGARVEANRLEMRKLVRQRTPLTPGVYGFFDINGRLNYVGKSKCLRQRLLSYFASIPPDDKMSRIVQHSSFLRWEPVCHELLALIREQELISRWRPSFNTQGQPQRRQPAFLCLSNREAAHVMVTTRINEKTRSGFGPIPGTGRLRETAEQLNHVFGLRDCNDQTPIRFSDQLELFPIAHPPGCIRHEIGSCLGPCTGTIRQADYAQQVNRLRDFLQGKDLSILSDLEQQMHLAASNRAFEKAALLRDQLQNLRWLNNRLNDLRRAHGDFSCIYPVNGFRKRKVWVCFNSSLITSVIPQPRSRSMAERAHQTIRQAHAVTRVQLPHDTTSVLMQLIVLSWFRKYPEERGNLMGFDEALSLCQKRLAA